MSGQGESVAHHDASSSIDHGVPPEKARAESEIAWLDSAARSQFIRLAIVVGAAYVVLIVLYYAFYSASPNAYIPGLGLKAPNRDFVAIIVTAAIVSALRVRHKFLRNMVESRRLVGKAKRRLDEVEDKIADSAEIDLIALWQASQERLNYYHEIAQTQSRRSFINGQIAIAIGFILLAVAVLYAVAQGTTASAIVSAGLGGVGAAMATYIGSTFFRSHDAASHQLASYFSQPVEFSRFLAAERLARQLEDVERSEAYKAIIDAIIRSNSAQVGTLSQDLHAKD